MNVGTTPPPPPPPQRHAAPSLDCGICAPSAACCIHRRERRVQNMRIPFSLHSRRNANAIALHLNPFNVYNAVCTFLYFSPLCLSPSPEPQTTPNHTFPARSLVRSVCVVLKCVVRAPHQTSRYRSHSASHTNITCTFTRRAVHNLHKHATRTHHPKCPNSKTPPGPTHRTPIPTIVTVRCACARV